MGQRIACKIQTCKLVKLVKSRQRTKDSMESSNQPGIIACAIIPQTESVELAKFRLVKLVNLPIKLVKSRLKT